MRISVRTFAGKEISLEVQPGATIRSIKEKIQDKEDIRIDLQRLLFVNEQLENNRSLFSYEIGEESVLHLVL
ncbi:unnamed protein product, partial [Rotaria sp. Silwood2]